MCSHRAVVAHGVRLFSNCHDLVGSEKFSNVLWQGNRTWVVSCSETWCSTFISQTCFVVVVLSVGSTDGIESPWKCTVGSTGGVEFPWLEVAWNAFGQRQVGYRLENGEPFVVT